jgi:hypothetical protein
MAITRFHKYEDLVAYLVENNVPHKATPAENGIEVPVQPNSGSFYVRWDPILPYIQIVYPFIPNVPAERLAAVESAISRVNTTIKLPGFGYEYKNAFVFMRLTVPVFEDGIAPTSFQRLVLGVLQNAKEFVGAFRDVIGGAAPETVLELAVKHSQTP